MSTENVSGESAVEYTSTTEDVQQAPASTESTQDTAEPANDVEAPADTEDKGEATTGEGKKRGGFQKKIVKLETTLSEKDSALSKKDAEIAELRAKLNQSAPKPENAATKPKAEDFETYDEFVEALTDYKAAEIASKKVEERFTDRDKKSQEEKAYEALQTKVQSHKERAESFKAQAPDYDEKVTEYIESGHVTQAVYAAVMESDASEKVAYYLATHPEEAMKLSNLGLVQVNREIGKIEAKLETSTRPAVRTTQAPPPIDPVRPTASTSSKKPEEMTQAEYEKWRFGR